MENKTFTYNYSAARNREVEAIRRKYIPQEKSKIELLKKLDLHAQTAGMIESLSLGIIGSLIFGVGACLLLEVLAGTAWMAALLLVFGTLLMLPAYPLYRYIARKTRAKLIPEILHLSEEIMKS